LNKYKKILISFGDFNGIGPEVTLKALKDLQSIYTETHFIILGVFDILQNLNAQLNLNLKFEKIDLFNLENLESGTIKIIELSYKSDGKIIPEYSKNTKLAGEFSARAIKLGAKLCLEKKADALVTAPISKESLNIAGYNYPGHTEFLSELSGGAKIVMMFITEKLRVGLVTIHNAIKDVPLLINKEKIVEKLEIMNNSLKRDFGILNPKIAVCALNPHAGESGLFGDEEEKIIKPAIKLANEKSINALGPFPSDTLFVYYQKYDAILAMYHDQGLIPVKMQSFDSAVNFTAGLPFIRTSPDHGTAYDIAGKFVANNSSMKEAIKLATELVKGR
jgi:4-hydroxythreonine-4-phosphate dehydrogenase